MTLDRASLIETLKKSVERLKKRQINMKEMTEDSELFNQLGLDSLDLLEMRFDIEESCNIQLEDKEAAGLRTVRDVVDLIQVKKGIAPSGS